MDIRKIHAELGWSPRQSLKTGLRETVKWYLDNSAWVEKIHQRSDYQTWIKDNYSGRRN
jgi:dTDP-glucose 4,6-dehydratase